MNRVLLAIVFVLGMAVPALSVVGENNPLVEADQATCFGSDTQDACENNATANCTWKTVMEGENPVSWCEMTLPWTPKE